MAPLAWLQRDQNGGVLVEVTVMIPIIFIFMLGAIDFLFAFYQWNAAAKAVQHGARIAAVSNPVATGLSGLSKSIVSVTLPIGTPMPYFKVTCGGGSCGCEGTCTGIGGFDAAAMNTIAYGRGSAACNDATSIYTAGMCDFFNRITPANVRIVYEQTGLGFVGRDSGPVPTISVSLQNLPFTFYFLGHLPGFGNIQIPARATITGEDLSSSGA
jgi:TadE-like protein